MSLDKSFDPKSIEPRLAAFWEGEGFFTASLENHRPRFSMALPPPNVTGTLHVGHALGGTLMDILARRRRMQGFNVLWQPGTDHAGIATQIIVERELEKQGKSKKELGRDGFLAEAWAWMKKQDTSITRQMRRLGFSCDWSRECFTLDEGLSLSVREAFCRLAEAGLLYRGKRLVNWDPVLQSAISDLEVAKEEREGFLWKIRYPLAGEKKALLVVATTRPETMLGDVAVAVHPEDERYRRWQGKKVILPLVGREIPVIADARVDPSFGTGCLKITPAHDFADHEIGRDHGLPAISIFTKEACLNDQAPSPYRGLDRYAARKKILEDLKAAGLLEGEEPHKLLVPVGERSGAVVEPMLTDQWFLKMKPLAEPALEALAQGKPRFFPEHWQETYRQWLTSIEDWCVSRQIWWGHPIPAFYTPDGEAVVARSLEEAQEKSKKRWGVEMQITPEEDVLDTWFSSALWPFSTLGWPEKMQALDLFYPTDVVIPGFDIIFFWVARMVMMGLHFTGKVPFAEVCLTGLVRDQEGRKMSKSRGNVIDPLDLVDGAELETLVAKRTGALMNPKDVHKVEKETRKQFPQGIPAFGADALRFGLASLSTQGRDVRLDLARFEGARYFANKLWNATRFVLMKLEGQELAQDLGKAPPLGVFDRWIRGRLGEVAATLEEHLLQYRFDLAAQGLHDFLWDDFCDWYVEAAKVSLEEETLAPGARKTLLEVLDSALRLLHPFMPFITEELWQKLRPFIASSPQSLMMAPCPQAKDFPLETDAQSTVLTLQEVVRALRALRSQAKVPPSQLLPIVVVGPKEPLAGHLPVIATLCRGKEVCFEKSLPENTPFATVGPWSLALVLLVDDEALQKKLAQSLAHLEKEIGRLEAKLANADFCKRAPDAVVAQEKVRLERLVAEKHTLEAQAKKLS